jgi:succinyl-CoA synthetase beta subunit
MRLTEAEGKALLRRHGISVPRGLLLSASGDAPPPPEVADWSGLVLKAQLVEGGRGKRGLVRRVAPNELAAAHRAMATIASDAGFLLEEAVDISRELYLALRLDCTRQGIELLLATEGGVEVEQTSALLRLPLDPEAPGAAETVFHALRGRLPPDLAARLAREAVRLARVMIEEDLELLEINPLAVTGEGRLVACDAKLVRDDAAAFRHDEAAMAESARLEERALTPLERRARQQDFTLVEMPGDVALVTAGAGLGMLMMDLLADHDLAAACFMDNRRGGPTDTTEARLEAAFELAARPEVKAILFYTTLASRPLADRVEGLLAFLARRPAPKPIFAGFAAAHTATRGFDVEAARERLAAAGIAALQEDPLTLVRAVAASVRPGAPA